MSLDKGAPTRHPLGRIAAFGAPMHGVVQGGTLTLPNATTMAHPQPATHNIFTHWFGSDGRPWMGAATYFVKRPGWAMPARTTEQLAADSAAGREWRDWAMLSGMTQYYAGKNLEGWVYFDDAGAAWAVKLTSIGGTVTAATMSFTFTRLGQFSSNPAAPTNRTTPVFDLMQSGAAMKYRPSSANSAALEVLPPEIDADMVLVSQTPDGSKSLWMRTVRHYPAGFYDGLGATGLDQPIAFIEVTIGAAKAVSAQTIRSRAQLMGTYARTLPGEPQNHRVTFYTESSGETQTDVCNFGLPATSEIFTAKIGIDLGETLGPEFDVDAARSYSSSLTGVTVAMWYDAAGVLHDITRSYSYSTVVSSTITPTASGTKERSNECDVNGDRTALQITGDTLLWDATVNTTVSETHDYGLFDNGVAAPGAHVAVVRTSTTAGVYTSSAPGSALSPSSVEYNTTTTDHMTVNGVVVVNVSGSTSGFITGGQNTRQPMTVYPGVGDEVFASGEPRLDADRALYSMSAWPGSGQEFHAVLIDSVRWSNCAIGIRTRSDTWTGPSWLLDAHEFFGIVTPLGAISHTETFTTPGEQRRVEVSGSLQPVSGEIATVVTDAGWQVEPAEPHSPKCWV
jgi:hypothetical protein